jgi:hypothetical protein
LVLVTRSDLSFEVNVLLVVSGKLDAQLIYFYFLGFLWRRERLYDHVEDGGLKRYQLVEEFSYL